MAVPALRAPRYTMVNGQSGAVSADPAALTIANYPLSDIVDPGGADTILLYWTATSSGPTDLLTVQAIVLDEHA